LATCPGVPTFVFYETKEDLLDTLISYCKAGLESGEFCLWVVAEPLKVEEASDALKDAVPDFSRYLANASSVARSLDSDGAVRIVERRQDVIRLCHVVGVQLR
jgi:hypothetical protein